MGDPPIESGRAGKRPIVLVHGAWHGGWCWERLSRLLTQRGYPVYAPTMTGLDPDAVEVPGGISLETHVQDIMRVIGQADLSNAVLVGHSYGGFVISAVADRLPKRIGALVYLDAFVPENGKCVMDYVPESDWRTQLVRAGVETGFVPAPALQQFGVEADADLKWATPKLRPQPYGAFTETIALYKPAGQGIRRSYITCRHPTVSRFEQFARQISADPSWTYYELRTGHDAMISAPGDLARLLEEIAAD
jgi:pimeloyl-ACP methyl ester carboxylesterase